MKVFVYGTLKKGFSNHRVMEAAKGEFISTGSLPNAVMFNLGYYPGLVLVPTSPNPIQGKIYEVGEKEIRSLDALEGHPTIYRREELEVLTSEGDLISTWVYLYQQPTDRYQIVTSGKWSR